MEHQIQLSEYKVALEVIHTELFSIDDQDSTKDLLTLLAEIENTLFGCCHRTRKLLKICAESGSNPSTSVDTAGSGVKLPKFDVPTFDGNILHWKQFWEQFCTSVHDRSRLTDAEKLVYLQHSLKNGSTKSIIEGLSHSGEQYSEAVWNV